MPSLIASVLPAGETMQARFHSCVPAACFKKMNPGIVSIKNAIEPENEIMNIWLSS
jgi:hypothetical protein